MTLTTCPNCDGTGFDSVFNSACDCSYWLNKQGTTSLAQHLIGTVGFLPSEQIRYSGANDGTGARRPAPTASPKSMNYLRNLVAERDLTGIEGVVKALAAPVAMTQAACSEYIDALKGQPYKAQSQITVAKAIRSNKFAGTCSDCGQRVEEAAGRLEGEPGAWIIRHLEGQCPVKAEVAPAAGIDLAPLEAFTSNGLVRVAVPNGDTRLKLRVKFTNGVIYVDDAAEYGMGNSYGRQIRGQAYQGDVKDELAAILVDPRAAIIRYTELVGRCGICNRHLEHAVSVAQGIGPVCARKLGL